MLQSIKNRIYCAIVEKKWLEISYVNRHGKKTRYYIGIKNIIPNEDRIDCDIFNVAYIDDSIVDKDYVHIHVSSIESASVLDETFYPTPIPLIEKLNTDQELSKYLEVDSLDNNILQYLSDCYRMDNDPYIKEQITIDGIDIPELKRDRIYNLNNEQFKKIINDVFKTKKPCKLRFLAQDLAMNSLAIEKNGKVYVIAYYSLAINFKNRTLKVADHPTINKSFLLDEDKRVSLSSYLDMNPDEFCANYESDELKYNDLIRQNINEDEGEIVNTKAIFFLIERKIQAGVNAAFNAIADLDAENNLTHPLRSFFGRNRCRNNISHETNIVVFNKNKINIDQMRVVYNSMLNHVTYVKGPPGTGKTETIFNVLLSAYSNNKTVLVCSNNNHPVDDIFDKMVNSITRKLPDSNLTEKIVFPIIRLGNNEEMKNSLLRLREYLEFANAHKKTFSREDLTEKSKNKSMAEFQKLQHLLLRYETYVELEETIVGLKQIEKLSTSQAIKKQIETRLATLEHKLKVEGKIENSDVTRYCVSAAEDSNFQNFLYYSSISHFKKLTNKANDDLRSIIEMEDLDKAVSSFNQFLKDDKCLARFLTIFPLIICTNLSCDKLGTPKPQFDLCIMDEAGQCNIASSLIPIVRTENLLLVGDTNQLQPVTVIEQQVNENFKARYSVGDDYDYVKNSILSTMLRKDKNSKSILLRYHYRCARNIADFSNKRFYNDQLKLINDFQGNLTYYNIKNHPISEERNSYSEEAKEIVNLIKKNKYEDVAIITPFVNQANLLNKYLAEENIPNVKAGTIHTLQGSEKSTIIMSAAISLKTAKKTMEWVKNNHELINVGVTRAKKDFIFVGDKEAIDALSKNDKETSDIKALSDYIHSNGKMVVPKSSAVISTDFSNASESEAEFFKTITPYFNNERRKNKIRIERNVPVKKAIKHVLPEDSGIIGKKEFDVIVQIKEPRTLFYKTVIVFEIDGGEHIGSKQSAIRDREKEKVCKHYGISLIRIANSQIKDYELIIRLFESVAKGIKDISDETFTQISLFEE